MRYRSSRSISVGPYIGVYHAVGAFVRERIGARRRFSIPRHALIALIISSMTGCGPALLPLSDDHLAQGPSRGEIPSIVRPPPLPPPQPEPERAVFSVSAQNEPLREFLYKLARDARVDLDIDPAVGGNITIHAVEQTLPQILERVARQWRLRYELRDRHLVIAPDTPFLRTYPLDYVNVSRQSAGTVSVATQIATTGSGNADNARPGSNNSTSVLMQESTNRFWDTIVENVRGILGQAPAMSSASDILVNRETGLLTVRATQRQHADVQRFLDQALWRAQQQVLIEATVVEVELSKRYQAGVDWSAMDKSTGLKIEQALTGANLSQPPVTTLTLQQQGGSQLLAVIKLLEQFGDLKVLSSPKIMTLNNQTAVLKVVDSRVYFTVSVDITSATASSPAVTTFESHVHTVPVGFVMAVTPQISAASSVTLNIRPTISRVLGFVHDPNPALAEARVVSSVPEIQVRELESVLKVSSGEIAVLGGLMQDSAQITRTGVPILSSLPVIGDLFSYRDDSVRKTELIIFLRPTVIREASVETDLAPLRHLLPRPTQPPGGAHE